MEGQRHMPVLGVVGKFLVKTIGLSLFQQELPLVTITVLLLKKEFIDSIGDKLNMADWGLITIGVFTDFHFYNTNGQLINTVDVVERGEGQINVFGSDLSTGIYTYTLVADGKIIASKKMMKQ